MTAHPVLSAALCFGLGIVLQAILMLQGLFRSGDAKRAGMALLFTLLGMMPGRHEHAYALLGHVFFSITVFGVSFAYLFRERLLTRIGGRLVLAWNILLIYVALHAGWDSRLKLALLAVPTIPTIVNAFSDLDRAFGWKVFFHAWFSTILVAITISGLDTGPLGMFFQMTGQIVPRPPLEMIVSGAAYLYIVTNAWFVLALMPVKGRGQSWHERMEEIHRHMALLARGYAWEKEDPLRSLAVLVGLPLLLVAAARWGAGSARGVVALAIATMPWLAGRMPDAAEPRPLPAPVRLKDGVRRNA